MGPDLELARSALAADPGATALVCDFDGTLAPIVDDPAAATPLPEAADVLRALAERYAVVAVVSGRPAAFLIEVFGAPGPLHVVGLYGLERTTPEGDIEVHPEVARWRATVEEVVARAAAVAPPGVVVEPKGLSVTLHVRTAPEHEPWARAFTAAEAARTGLAHHDARRSFELRPPVPIDKGTVVADLVRRPPVAVAAFIGDDIGDLPAFALLDTLVAQGHLRRAVKLVVTSTETPPALAAAADAALDGPAAALAFLRDLL